MIHLLISFSKPSYTTFVHNSVHLEDLNNNDGWEFHVAPLIRVATSEGPKIFVSESAEGYLSVKEWAETYLNGRFTDRKDFENLHTQKLFRFVPASLFDVTQDKAGAEVNYNYNEVEKLALSTTETFDQFAEKFSASPEFWNALNNLLLNKGGKKEIEPGWEKNIPRLQAEVIGLLNSKLGDDAGKYVEMICPKDE